MNEKLKTGLIGAHGRLGSAVAALAQNHPSIHLQDLITRHTDPSTLSSSLLINASTSFQAGLTLALRLHCPLVSATTGLTSQDLYSLDEASKTIPLFHASNFSLGMALLHKLASDAARLFPSSIHLIETHHIHKKDAPSGSALSLTRTLSPLPVQITSRRLGETIGEHTLTFSAPEETLSISHSALDRSVFAKGILQAALFLKDKPPALYTMDDLFK